MRTRRARALLETEFAEADVTAPSARVAKARLAVIDAEASDEERAQIEQADSPPLEKADAPPLPPPSQPPDSAPAVVLPVPLNVPTIYHALDNDDDKDEQDKVDVGKRLCHFMEKCDIHAMDFLHDALEAEEQ